MAIFDKPLSPGEHLGGRYEVVSFLGSGASGHVYRVRDHHLDKEVALKLFEPRPGEAATWDEAQLLERLQSEYLLPVYNADILPLYDLRYLTTPVMSAGDLGKRSKDHGVAPMQAVRWGMHIATGLSRVHDAGLLHRDIKPENAFLSDTGDAVLGDLGMTMRVDQRGRCPANGTLETVAPEVLQVGGECSVASDVYSLAATVFHLLCGQFPVSRRGGRAEILDRVRRGDRRKLRDLAPHVSQGLSMVVERGLSFDPQQRPSGALQFANQLAQARCHSRSWRKATVHVGHEMCIAGDAVGARKPLTLCIVANAAGRFDIQIHHESGRRGKKNEIRGLTWDKALVEVRRLAGEL